MEVKKTKQANMSLRSSLYFLIGLNIVLLATLLILEFSRKYIEPEPVVEKVVPEIIDEEVLITERQWDEPPPPIEAPAPPEIPVEVDVVEDDVEIETQPDLAVQDDTQPVPTPPIKQGKPAPPSGPPPTKPPKKEAPPPLDTTDEEMDRTTAKRGPIFPGCEDYANDSRKLYQCLNEKFGSLLSNAIDPDFELPENKPMRVTISFVVDKNGNLILKAINQSAATKELGKNAQNAFNSVAAQMERKSKRGKGIKPAINSKDQPGPFKYSIPVTYRK